MRLYLLSHFFPFLIYTIFYYQIGEHHKNRYLQEKKLNSQLKSISFLKLQFKGSSPTQKKIFPLFKERHSRNIW